MESPQHRELRVHAARLLRGQFGCYAVATEVTAPVPRFRIDAAGIGDSLPRRAPEAAPEVQPIPQRGKARRTVFIEAKVARSDFLRDAVELPRLLARRSRLERELEAVRHEFVQVVEPTLQDASGLLFPDLGAWDYSRSTLHCHRLLVRELARIDTAIHGTTKFFCVARYALATQLYILCPRGLVEPAEVPGGWGLLWAEGEAVADGGSPPAVVRDAPENIVRERDLDRTLRAIAIAASRSWLGPPQIDRAASKSVLGSATADPASVQHGL